MIPVVPLLGLLLVGGRIAGLIFSVPIFGSRNYPIPLKIALIAFLSILIAPYAEIRVPIDLSASLGFLAMMVNEVLIGLFLGLLVTFYFNFIYFAGDLIDYQIGFSMVSIINPLDESQIPLTSNLFFTMSTLIFLVLNLHHKLILALVNSFQAIRIGSFLDVGFSLSHLLEIVGHSFAVGLSIAAPFMITILVSDIILGLLSKAMPGMNIFVLGVPFKILIGVILMMVIFPLLFQVFGDILDRVFLFLRQFMEGATG